MPIEHGPLRRVRTLVVAGLLFFVADGNEVARAGPAPPPSSTSAPPCMPAPLRVPAPSLAPAPSLEPYPSFLFLFAPSFEPSPPLAPAPSAVPAPWETPPLITEPTPPAEPSPWSNYLQAIGKKIEEAHARIERDILEQTVRFDNFFGTVRSENLRPERYELRLRSSLRVDRDGRTFSPGESIRANFVLSKISERLRLVIAGEGGTAPPTQSLPKDPGSPGFDRTTPATHFANTELRYELIQKPSLDLFLGAGFNLKLPFEAFARTRAEYKHSLSDVSLLRFAETFFVKNTDLLGETTEVAIERSFGPDMLLRWANAGTASQEIEGLEWGSELSLFKELSPRSAITLIGGVYGNPSQSALVANSRIAVLYRRNFLRPWLFYELEPEVYWPRAIEGTYTTTFAVTFRLEVAFLGAASVSR